MIRRDDEQFSILFSSNIFQVGHLTVYYSTTNNGIKEGSVKVVVRSG